MRRHARLDERGVIAGLEGLAFGLLVFVLGTIVISNAWLIVDHKLATSAAAREAARAYVEADSKAEARASAKRAADAVMAGHGANHGAVSFDRAGFSRCSEVRVEVRATVPLVSVPLLGAEGGKRIVRADHTEVVDPYRSGLAGLAAC